MIEFRCSSRDKTGTPILYNTEIWDYAERVVGDYKPALLREPTAINSVHFLESYLGAAVEYQDIYYREGEPAIAGATVFNDDEILVFDREGLCIRTIHVPANTIILDNSITEEGLEGFASFTALHEGGHLSLHSGVYKKNTDQLSFFEPEKKQPSTVCCRKTGIEKVYRPRRATYTPEEMREHQANVFAAFAAMPRQTFVPFAQELIRDVGFKKGIYVNCDDGWEYEYHLGLILDKLKSTYGVSRTAARIHLKELGLLITKYEYEQRKAQLTIRA